MLSRPIPWAECLLVQKRPNFKLNRSVERSYSRALWVFFFHLTSSLLQRDFTVHFTLSSCLLKRSKACCECKISTATFVTRIIRYECVLMECVMIDANSFSGEHSRGAGTDPSAVHARNKSKFKSLKVWFTFINLINLKQFNYLKTLWYWK